MGIETSCKRERKEWHFNNGGKVYLFVVIYSEQDVSYWWCTFRSWRRHKRCYQGPCGKFIAGCNFDAPLSPNNLPRASMTRQAHAYHEPIVSFCSRLMIQCVAFVPPTKYWFWWVWLFALRTKVLTVDATPLFLLDQVIVFVAYCLLGVSYYAALLSEWV